MLSDELQRHYYVLALYPSAKGMAFVLFEDSLSLVDWGTTVKYGTAKNHHCIDFTTRLLDRYVVDVIVVHDTTGAAARRSDRVEALYRSFVTLAQIRNIDLVRYTSADVNQAFDAAGALTKQERAQLVSEMVPALSERIPPVRKAWHAEHPRMALFEAAALGIAHYYHQHSIDPKH